MPFLSRVSLQRTVRPWGAGRSTNSRGSSTSTGGDRALSSFWVGAERVSALPCPQQVPSAGTLRQGRQDNSPLCVWEESTQASCSELAPAPRTSPAAQQALLDGSAELGASLLFCFACGEEPGTWSQTAWVQTLVPPLTLSCLI